MGVWRYPQRTDFIWTVLLSALMISCSPKGKKVEPVVTQCVLPQDQSGTLEGMWRVTPVPIAFREGDFSLAERQAMAKAANAWNNFSIRAHGFSLLDYGGAADPRTIAAIRPASVCSQSILAGDDYNAPIVVYKQQQWPYSSHSAIAVTSLCPDRTSNSGYPKFYMASVELNYQDFFVSGKRMPDLQSIVAHELGHLIGLRHSCEAVGRIGMPNCKEAVDPSYISALLYPVFGFDSSGIGEQRHDLNENDQGRTNCLYQDEE